MRQFRSDIESFVSRDSVDQCSKAGGDSFTMCIAHLERGKVIVDLVRETKPPFSPGAVCADYAATCKSYGITTATADRWPGQFPVGAMRRPGSW
jgi:hypothetical protein